MEPGQCNVAASCTPLHTALNKLRSKEGHVEFDFEVYWKVIEHGSPSHLPGNFEAQIPFYCVLSFFFEAPNHI